MGGIYDMSGLKNIKCKFILFLNSQGNQDSNQYADFFYGW